MLGLYFFPWRLHQIYRSGFRLVCCIWKMSVSDSHSWSCYCIVTLCHFSSLSFSFSFFSLHFNFHGKVHCPPQAPLATHSKQKDLLVSHPLQLSLNIHSWYVFVSSCSPNLHHVTAALPHSHNHHSVCMCIMSCFICKCEFQGTTVSPFTVVLQWLVNIPLFTWALSASKASSAHSHPSHAIHSSPTWATS